MLRPAGQNFVYEEMELPIEAASYPAPFASKLEFNPASHGTWNIVHIGMNVPEAHQIYVCAVNCMRGVVLTAAEMNRSSRFSFVLLREEDLVEGTVEEITIEGTADVIRKLPTRPPAVALFTVCTHHFLGCDLNWIFRSLEEQFPDIDFIRGYMDPIMQKESPTPDVKLRRDMYSVLPKLPPTNRAAILGHNVPLDPEADLLEWLSDMNYASIQASTCRSYKEYKSMGDAGLFISCVPNGNTAIQVIGRRLERRSLYLPMTFSYEEIAEQYEMLTGRQRDFDEKIAACEAEAVQTHELLKEIPIFIDYTAHPRPLGLARYLLERGFCVEKVYLNGISPEEKEAYDWMKLHAPKLLLTSTILPPARVITRGDGRCVLAIGQQAAWFQATSHFVNIVEGGGLQGFYGIRRMLELMREAWNEEKDTRDLVPRKGLGCESCV